MKNSDQWNRGMTLPFRREKLQYEFYEISFLMAWFWFFRHAYQGKLLVVSPFHQWLQPHCRHLEFLFFWTGNCICRDQDFLNLPKSWKPHGFVAGMLLPKKYGNIKVKSIYVQGSYLCNGAMMLKHHLYHWHSTCLSFHPHCQAVYHRLSVLLNEHFFPATSQLRSCNVQRS